MRIRPKHLYPLALLLAGCLSPVTAADDYQMCDSTSDCRGSQVCDEGVCWGEPPATERFAVVAIPPADRPELAPTEITDFSIANDGTISGLEFSKSIQLHGRITLGCGKEQTEQCGDSVLVPAQVIVERLSNFDGGPPYRRTILTNIEAGLNEDSFVLSLPEDGQEYRVTVIPNEASLDSLAAGGAQIQAPPYSTTIVAMGDLAVDWEIGKPEQLKTLEGCITSALGNGAPFAGMHVSALGRWSNGEKATRASSIVTTDEIGCFALSVPIDMLNEFDVVAKPGPGLTLPTLKLYGENVPDPMTMDDQAPPHRLEDLVMPNAANPVTFKLPLSGLASGGALEPIGGATVFMRTVFEVSPMEERDIEVSFVAQSTSNGIGDVEEGVAVIELYPGSFDNNRSYELRVQPAPDSEYASVWNTTVSVGTGEGAPVLEGIALERRVALTGILATSSGSPLPNTPVSVRPSVALRNGLGTPSERAILDNLQFSTDLSGEGGEFLLWLDATLLGQVAQYNLDLSPPDFSSAPSWTFQDVSLDANQANQGSVDLGILALPAASYARGEVRDSEGHLVSGAELRWFHLPEGSCSAESCSPARLMGIWESDESGKVLAVLPES